VHRVGQVAVAGSLVLFGCAACTAAADSSSPSSSATAGAGGSATPAVSRQPIEVRLSPGRVTNGTNKNVRILALCPVPQGGTDHTATASSTAFTGAVTLTPAPPVTPSPSAASPVSSPELRGAAIVPADAKAGRYDVTVRCEGTNDSGTARLTVVSRPKTTPTPTRKPVVPTGAPHAGGGGTAAGGPGDTSALPLPVTGLALLGALGVGVVLARRKRS